MIPAEASPATSSDAERAVFRLLAGTDMGNRAVAMHSLNLARHYYKLCSEVDFLVIAPEGVLVLEVKGGGVSCHNGVWSYRDRYGTDHRSSEGPFHQAQSAMFSLRRTLLERISDPRVRDVLFGWATVLPDVRFDVSSVEWAPQTIIDRSAIRAEGEGLERSLRKAFAYWRQALDRQPVNVSAELTADLLRALRPDFERVPVLGSVADALDVRMEQLTEAQYVALDLITEYDRVLIHGGAGSGKTFLAMEAARRETAAGRSTLLFCHSPVLAAYLASQAPPDLQVASVKDLSRLPMESFDALIIDEAQDLMTFALLEELGERIAGGIEAGRWRIFYDANNQSGVTGDYEAGAMEYLLAAATAPPMHLPRNCRNTSQIVTQTQLTTGADIGVSQAGEGPSVEWVYPDSRDAAAHLLRAHIRNLGRQGVEDGDITILSPQAYSGSVANELPEAVRDRVREVDPDVAARWPVSTLTYAQVSDFKGLENQFVALVDLDQLSLHDQINTLYVAMTRARASLWIAWPGSRRDELAELQRAHLPELIGT